MNESIVSICIPTFEEEKDIQKCLDSLSQQTMFSLSEVIIADYDPQQNHKTFNAVKEWARNHKGRVKYVPVKGSGIALARNVAVQNSTAPIITTFDADAFFGQKDALQKLINPMVNGYFWTTCENYIDDKSNELANMMFDLGNLISSFGVGGFEPGLTITRDAYDTVGGFSIGTRIGEGRELDAKLTLYYGIKRRMHLKDVYIVCSARRYKNMSPLDINPILDYTKAYRGEKVIDMSPHLPK